MSYQVGMFCYASPVDAGTATCSRFSPVSIVSSAGTHLVSTSCESVNPETGALQLRVATSEIASGAVTYQIVEQLPAYFPCQQGQFVEAGFNIFFAIVAVCIPLGAWYAINKFMFSNRGENT